MAGSAETPVLGTPGLVQWKAVFAGAVVGLAMFSLLSILWLALALASQVKFVDIHLSWFEGVSAIFSLFVGAFLTGWLSGMRGRTPGLLNGVAMWGLLVIAALGLGIPAVLAVFHIVPPLRAGAPGLWPTFWSVLIAFGTAALGGMLGGASPRANVAYLSQPLPQAG